MTLSLSEQKKQQLETASQNLKQNLKKLGISVGYKVLDDGLILSIDLESLVMQYLGNIQMFIEIMKYMEIGI